MPEGTGSSAPALASNAHGTLVRRTKQMLCNYRGVWLAALALVLLGVRSSDAQQGQSPNRGKPGLSPVPAAARVAPVSTGNLQYVGGLHHAGENRISTPVWHERREYRHYPYAT